MEISLKRSIPNGSGTVLHPMSHLRVSLASLPQLLLLPQAPCNFNEFAVDSKVSAISNLSPGD
jgi:hypothetical protein